MTTSEASKDEFRSLADKFGLLGGVAHFMDRAGQLKDCHFSTDKMDEIRRLRWRLLMDIGEGEVYEYRRAEFHDDPVEIADGLCDIIYVALGSLLQYFGVDAAEDLLLEVWGSNLSKVGDDMIKDDAGKVLKPPSYFAPDLRAILAAHGVL